LEVIHSKRIYKAAVKEKKDLIKYLKNDDALQSKNILKSFFRK
jgi:ribosomal protein S15P/S13E